MKILLAVVAVVAMVAACQVEPNVTPIPAATSRHIDSAVTGCRDAAFAQYADSPFRLGWAQAECDKAGEEARKGDWDRGLLPTPSTLSPEPTATATATPDPTPTPEPLATGYVWRVDWYLECPDSYESSRYGTQYPTGSGALWLLDEWGKQTEYTGHSIHCGGKQSGQRIGSTYFVKRDTDCANSPRLYYPLSMLRTGAGTPVDIGCVNPAYVLGVGIHYENFYTASHHNPSARGDTTVTRESYESLLPTPTPSPTPTPTPTVSEVRTFVSELARSLDQNPWTVIGLCVSVTYPGSILLRYDGTITHYQGYYEYQVVRTYGGGMLRGERSNSDSIPTDKDSFTYFASSCPNGWEEWGA